MTFILKLIYNLLFKSITNFIFNFRDNNKLINNLKNNIKKMHKTLTKKGKYKYLKLLGKGAYGKAYLVKCTRDNVNIFY